MKNSPIDCSIVVVVASSHCKDPGSIPRSATCIFLVVTELAYKSIFLPSLLDREKFVIPPSIVFCKIYFLKKEEAMGREWLIGAIKLGIRYYSKESAK